jgi:hypothetical protein
MPTIGNTPRPAYVYDTETDTWVPVGVGAHTHSDIPNTLVDAKGDLITATADNVPARLAKGADGTVLVADSSTSTGLAWQPYATQQVAGKNAIINGNFDFWHRGTSFAAAGAASTSTYTADRWNSGANNNITISRVAASTEGSTYALRLQKNSTTTTGGDAFICHTIESNNVILLAGKTVTLSFNVRSGANFSGAAVYCVPRFGTGLDEGSLAGYNGQWTGTNQSIHTVIPTATMTRYEKTFTVPSGTKELMLLMGVQSFPGTAAGVNDWVEFEKVQLEIGSVATPFSRAGGNIQGELAACQRYYYRTTSTNAFAGIGGNGFTFSSTQANVHVQLPVPMRTYPSSCDFSNVRYVDFANAAANISQISLWQTTTNVINATVADFQAIGTGFTTGRGLFLQTSAGGGYIGFNAEL